MNRVGSVVGVAQGLAVCRSPDDQTPTVGTRVVDDSLTAVGEVVEVFGPVDRPYVAVTPVDGVHLPGLVGERLYTDAGP